MHADPLKTMLNGMTPQPEDGELPELGSAYQAHARPSNKPLYTLHMLLGKEGVVSFQYKDLDSNTTFRVVEKGQEIVIRFGGMMPARIIIRGRNLWRLYDYIHQHRMAWLARADRDFADGKDPIIVSIDPQPYNRNEREESDD